jgi:2-amino-4-hydroxy-6-hydroxymethyldihydropteridine diphosphokinase
MMIRKEHEPVDAYIALGSNIEPRGHYIQQAMNLLSDHPQIEVIEMSSVYETRPVGGPAGQGPYLNAVTKIHTTLAPMELLSVLQKIEKELGRKRNVHWGPRTIDLDILLYSDEIISNDRLIVPHPLMHERRFVMQPLSQIAPDVIHPILQMSARTILESLGEGEEDEMPGRIES